MNDRIIINAVMSKSIFDFFPPPRFLQMPSVGISISDNAIRFADLRQVGGVFKLHAYAEKKIPPGFVSGGYIHNIEGLTKLISEFREMHNLSFARIALPEEKAYLFKTEIPATDDKILRESVEFKIEENVPISVSNSVFDFTVLKHHKKNEDKAEHMDVIVSVLPIKVVSTYIEVLEGAGLTPTSFQVESQAIARSVIKRGDMETCLIVNLGEEKAALYVVSNELVQFASTFLLSKGSAMYTLESTPSFAIKALKEKEAFCDEFWMQQVADEIKKLFSYWHTHEDKQGELGKRISKVLIVGDHPNVLGCLGSISASVDVLVEIGNVWINAFSFDQFVPDLPLTSAVNEENTASSLKFAAAIGLALPE